MNSRAWQPCARELSVFGPAVQPCLRPVSWPALSGAARRTNRTIALADPRDTRSSSPIPDSPHDALNANSVNTIRASSPGPLGSIDENQLLKSLKSAAAAAASPALGTAPSDAAAAASQRLQTLSNTLLDRLRDEAGQRATLQSQLLEAQGTALEAVMAAEGAAAEANTLRGERSALVARADLLATSLAMVEARNARLAAEVQALSNEVDASITARDILVQERAELMARVEAQSQAIKEAASLGDQDVAALRVRTHELEEKLVELGSQLAAGVTRQTELERALVQARAAIALATEKAAANATGPELAKLQRELELAQEQAKLASQTSIMTQQVATELAASRYAMSAKNAEIAEKLQASQRDAAAASASLEVARVQVAALQAEVEGLRAQVATRTPSPEPVEPALRAEVAKLQKELQLAQEAAKASSQTAAMTQQSSTELAASRYALSGTNSDLSAKLTASQREAAAARTELEAVRTQVAALEAQLEALKGPEGGAALAREASPAPGSRVVASQLRVDVQRLQMQVESSERERQLEVGVIVQNYAHMAQQNAISATQLSALKSQAAAVQQEAAVAVKAKIELEAQVQALRADIDTARAQATQATTALDTAHQQAAAAEAARKVAVAAAEAARKMGAIQVAAAEQEIAAAQADAAAARAETEETKQAVEVLAKRLAATEAILARRAAVSAKLSAPKPPAEGDAAALEGTHANTNRYWVEAGCVFGFMKALAAREAAAQAAGSGFLGMRVKQLGPQDFVVSTLWDAPGAFDAWTATPEGKAAQGSMPQGVFQYSALKKNEGVPDDYVPYKGGPVPAPADT